MEFTTAWAEILAAIIGVAASGLGTIAWFLYQSVRKEASAATEAVTAVKDELSRYKLYVAERYVTQADLTKAVTSLERSIERLIEAVNQSAQEARNGLSAIHQRIDQKADK